MAAPKTRHGQRAPRYRFENHTTTAGGLVRFARGRHRPVMTRIYDVSESGIAILVSYRLAPTIGEVIRLEFAPPGAMQIACLGRVVRVEDATNRTDWKRFPDTVKLGIAFVNMPDTYKELLSQGISQTIGRQQYQRQRETPVHVVYRSSNSGLGWLRANMGSILVSIALIGLLVFTLYYIVEKGSTLDTKKQNDWANNFFEKVIPEKPSR